MKATTKKKAAPKKRLANKSTGLQAPAQTQTEQVMSSLMTSIASGDLEPELLKMVLDAQERILDRQAKQEYSIAMQAVQAEMPAVKKNQENKQTHSNYADLDAVIKTVTPIYTKHGFSLSTNTIDSPLEFHIRLLTDVMHVGGWSEQKQIDIPLDMVGLKGGESKTKVHGTGSAFSYGRRYLQVMIFNLTTNDDDDGAAAGDTAVEVVDKNQVANIEALLEEVGGDRAAFLRVCKIDSFENLPASKFHTAIEKLEAKRSA